ncbi:MAG TPA: SurA N-terminal domain-containing protein [Pyrinomonadaceae bacterium]|nr:SurA N-terminal domain-containing protein [Pyrinomonadaceae bacterium]
MQRVVSQIAFVLVVASLAITSAACSGKKDGPGSGSDVAATVNGKDITLGEVDRIISQQTSGQQAKMSTIQLAAARLQVLDKLIERQMLVQRAEKEKTVPTDDEITTAINNQKNKMTAEEWEKFLKDNNLTDQILREEARKDLAINKLQEKLYGKITIRDQEIVDFFNANKEQYVNPRGVSLADIVADPRDSGTSNPDDAKSDTDAKVKIDRLYAQLRSGADFATVAQASSEDQSAVRGGDIGFANEQDLQQTGFQPDLINRFFNTMKVGDITEPMRFPDGRWIIFKLTNRRLETKPLALEDPGVRDQIKQGLISQRQTILNEALIRNAMSDSQVTNKLAESMLNDPNMLGGLQQASPGTASTPAAATTPAATASPTATPTPQPTATAQPAATPKAAPTRPAAAPSPK